MFQLKKTDSKENSAEATASNPAIPGKVRTFKEDFENFQKGGTTKDNSEKEIIPPQKIEENGSSNIFAGGLEAVPPVQPAPKPEDAPGNPFQSVPSPAPVSYSGVEMPAFKSSPSQSFFEEMPPKETTFSQGDLDLTAKKKTKGRFFLIVFILLLVAGAGGGFYYYWFYLKNGASFSFLPKNPSSSSDTTPPAQSQNDSVRRLIVDTSQSPTEIKNAVQKFATEYASSTTENDLAEIKILDKNNQAIGKKDFFSGFGAKIPDTLLAKLSEEFSLFAVKQNGTVRMGIAFKTITSSGVSEEMKGWEPTMVNDLGSLYPVPVTTPLNSAFNSGRYKNADIRYFNFSSPANTSLDYTVISNFIIIGTSKDSVRAILDYMAQK